MVTLTKDTSEVAYLMERDWRLRHLIEAVGDPSYEVTGGAYEHVAHSVIEQMLSMKVGQAIESRLRGLCGGKITCEAVLSLSVEEIRSCGVAARKVATLQELARTLPERALQALAGLPDDEVRAALMAARGIGRWTADMFLIFCLAVPTCCPWRTGPCGTCSGGSTAPHSRTRTFARWCARSGDRTPRPPCGTCTER